VDGLSAVQLNSLSMTSAVGLATTQTQHKRHPAMDAAATMLGMSDSDLRTALQSGKSLASIASSKGITQDALTAAMTAAIQQANPGISTDQATKVASEIATRTPPVGGPGGPPPVGGPGGPSGTDSDDTSTTPAGGTTATRGHHHHHHPAAAAVDSTSQLLGVSTTDLISSLQSGQSLASIAKSKGVSQSDLVQTIAAALQKSNSSLSADQAAQLATQLATQTRPSQADQTWGGGSAGENPSTYGVLA